MRHDVCSGNRYGYSNCTLFQDSVVHFSSSKQELEHSRKRRPSAVYVNAEEPRLVVFFVALEGDWHDVAPLFKRWKLEHEKSRQDRLSLESP